MREKKFLILLNWLPYASAVLQFYVGKKMYFYVEL